jgi:mannose/fructose/N-acetylgalactosamine-specific phosphotransferase system component IID
MYLIAIAWMYVVLMMAVAEALSPQGSVLGALITFVFYGLLPLSVVLYIFGTPMRRRARLAAEAKEAAEAAEVAQAAALAAPASAPPDGHSHAAGDAVAAVRKEV